MKQRAFAFTRTPRPKPTIAKQSDRYRPDNDYSAAAILADPARFGGETAGLVQWARLHTERYGPVEREIEAWQDSPDRKALR